MTLLEELGKGNVIVGFLALLSIVVVYVFISSLNAILRPFFTENAIILFYSSLVIVGVLIIFGIIKPKTIFGKFK